jgi:hypothetical protein
MVTGGVRIDPLIQAPAGSVTFEPGAAPPGIPSVWTDVDCHRRLRPRAELGGSVGEIRLGDVSWFAPGERPWNGAAATTAMMHSYVYLAGLSGRAGSELPRGIQGVRPRFAALCNAFRRGADRVRLGLLAEGKTVGDA